jgi:hypothetical protein
VAAGDVLHDVALNHLVLQDRDPVVDEDRRRRRLEVGPGVDFIKPFRPKFANM